jgi:hypothetical protein
MATYTESLALVEDELRKEEQEKTNKDNRIQKAKNERARRLHELIPPVVQEFLDHSELFGKNPNINAKRVSFKLPENFHDRTWTLRRDIFDLNLDYSCDTEVCYPIIATETNWLGKQTLKETGLVVVLAGYYKPGYERCNATGWEIGIGFWSPDGSTRIVTEQTYCAAARLEGINGTLLLGGDEAGAADSPLETPRHAAQEFQDELRYRIARVVRENKL